MEPVAPPLVLPLARLYVEAVGGVAGDMLLAALISLGADLVAIRSALASLGEPGLDLQLSEVDVGGERACYVRSLPSRPDAHGRHLHEVLATIARGNMSAGARGLSERIFTLLGNAEAASHGEDIQHVHLHEVGAIDSVLDVVGIAVAYDSIGSPRVSVGPLPSGHGEVQCSHGRLAVPVPAVQYIVRQSGLVLVDVPVLGETITPTGAAALAVLGRDFGATLSGNGDCVGVGAGTRRFADRPNVLRLHGYHA